MKISQKMTDAINEQVNKELWSGYIYLSMSTQFEEDNFGGFASWMRAQATEELEHAMKLFDYVISRGGRVILKAIPEVPTQWASPLAAFEEAYNHELKVTKMIEGKEEAVWPLMNRANNIQLKNIPLSGKIKGKIKCHRKRSNILLPNADVALCCNDYGLQHIIGNLLNQSYDSLFHSNEFRRVKAGMQDNASEILCRYCSQPCLKISDD